MTRETLSVRDGAHKSRTQDERESEGVHEDSPILFQEAGPLPVFRPRPGYSQRWVRIATKEGDDAGNMARMAQRGWKPRDPATIPKAMQMYTVKREGMGGVIGTHDCILMERHQGISDQESARKKSMRRDLEKAVKGNLFNETRGAVEHESRSNVERGRPVHIADD